MLVRVLVCGALLLAIYAGAAGASTTLTTNQRVVNFLESKVGVRVGGGECAHAASEALRVAGGEFIKADLGQDTPGSGDYVWGTLPKIISVTNGVWSDSAPSVKLLPGDILQFGNVKIVIGTTTWTAVHHTAIVAAVDTTGMPTTIYQQNAAGVRSLTKDPINLKKLTTGWIRCYRPKVRRDKTGQYKCTIVNNFTTGEAVAVKFGSQTLTSLSLTATNTANSYTMVDMASSSATATFTLQLSTGSKITIANAGGYEIYSASGRAAIRKLTP